MRSKNHSISASIVIIVGIAILSSTNALAIPPYEITEIHLAGSEYTFAKSINDSGQIVGGAYMGPYYNAFFWENGLMKDVGLGYFYDLNNSGQAVGFLRDPSLPSLYRPVLWEHASTIHLDLLGGINGAARGINDYGQIVGYVKGIANDQNEHAILWETGTTTDLYPHYSGSHHAVDINNLGQVLVWSSTEPPPASIWQNGSTIAQNIPLYDQIFISDSGMVGGATAPTFPAIWQNGVLTELPVPSYLYDANYSWGESRGANDLGQIVGYAAIQDITNGNTTTSHALLWQNGNVFDLNTLDTANSGWLLQGAEDINERGQIIGWGLLNGEQRSFMMSSTWEGIASVDYNYYINLTLGRNIVFDYWWDMGNNPPPYSGQAFDVLALQAGAGWQYIGQIAAYGSSTDWETMTLGVPEDLWGLQTQLRFVLNDYGPYTDPTVYLRNVNSAPVPEPATMLLLASGLVGLAGMRRKFTRS